MAYMTYQEAMDLYSTLLTSASQSELLENLKQTAAAVAKSHSFENMQAFQKAAKKAYQALALAYHPDKNNKADATETFQKIAKAYETFQWVSSVSGRMAATTDMKAEYEDYTEKKKKSTDYIYIDMKDAMKNSLFSYYIKRFGGIPEVQAGADQLGYNMIRTMLCDILGISAFAFEGYFNPEGGYIFYSSRPEVIDTINTFLKSIRDHDVEQLQTQSNKYEVPLAAVQGFLGLKEGIPNPDALLSGFKTLIGLPNTSPLYIQYDKEKQIYNVWIKPIVGRPIPPALAKMLGTTTTKPVVNPTATLNDITLSSKKVKPQTTEQEQTVIPEAHESNVQIGFIIDATGSMGDAIKGLKQCFTNIGDDAKKIAGTDVSFTLIEYHDYGDKITVPTGKKEFNFYDYSAKRITDEDEGYDIRSAADLARAEAATKHSMTNRRDAPVAIEKKSTTSSPENEQPKLTKKEKKQLALKETQTQVGKTAREEWAKKNKEASEHAASEETSSTPTTDPSKKRRELNYTGAEDPTPQPRFTTADKIASQLELVSAQGGEDTAEATELGFGVAATGYKWEGDVRILYAGMDAPPHFHYEGSQAYDRYRTAKKIQEQQTRDLYGQGSIMDAHPVLKKALNPEDWVTQILVLASLGVEINMLICRDDNEVEFMATFIAALTGGKATNVRNWGNLSDIMKEDIKAGCIDAGITSTALTAASEAKKSSEPKPESKYEKAVFGLLEELRSAGILDRLFAVKDPLQTTEGRKEITQLAETVREKYTVAIKRALKKPLAFIATEPQKKAITEKISTAMKARRAEDKKAITAGPSGVTDPLEVAKMLLVTKIRLLEKEKCPAGSERKKEYFGLVAGTPVQFGRSGFGSMNMYFATEDVSLSIADNGEITVLDKQNGFKALTGEDAEKQILDFCKDLKLTTDPETQAAVNPPSDDEVKEATKLLVAKIELLAGKEANKINSGRWWQFVPHGAEKIDITYGRSAHTNQLYFATDKIHLVFGENNAITVFDKINVTPDKKYTEIKGVAADWVIRDFCEQLKLKTDPDLASSADMAKTTAETQKRKEEEEERKQAEDKKKKAEEEKRKQEEDQKKKAEEEEKSKKSTPKDKEREPERVSETEDKPTGIATVKKEDITQFIDTLIDNINGVNKVNNTRTLGFSYGSEAKTKRLDVIKMRISELTSITEDQKKTALALIKSVCAMKRNPIGLFAPHSSREFTQQMEAWGIEVKEIENIRKFTSKELEDLAGDAAVVHVKTLIK